MSIAISDDHQELGRTVRDFMARHDSRAAARALLDGGTETQPAFHSAAAELGWLGLHLPEAQGGSGFGMPELVVVAEEYGRALAPGSFVPTVIASSVLSASGIAEAEALVAGLADGSANGAVALTADVEQRDGALHGSCVALGAALAQVLLVPVGADVAVVDTGGAGVAITEPVNMDPTRRAGSVTLDGAAAIVLPGAARRLRDVARTVLGAEAVGVARECTELAAEYAKARIQFGRPIAMYQAVKHHCANMAVATELATAAVWDAARAADGDDADQFSYAAATAAALALPAADLCANLNTQVHGGIGFTWEHDAHLYLRRATAMLALLDPNRAAADITDLTRDGVRRSRSIELPPEAEAMRAEVRSLIESVQGLDPAAIREKLVESGYAMPHWPTPYGRAAGAVEQLVIEQEFSAAGIQRPAYGITGWVILTLIQHGNDDQVARWVKPALDQELIWCQLFSEPDAGSDAAGITTRGTRVDGGWKVTGQKVWTSGAHLAKYGFATVRTNPDVPKHQGITMMVIDMEAQGVTVRPLKQCTGGAEFNEVFFDEVFVPDDDVVGPVDGGWTVARATLGNESVSIGGGQGGMAMPADVLIGLLDSHPDRLPGGAARIGRYVGDLQAMSLLNLRSAHRAVAGGAPGPEGNITKLVLSELGHEAAAIATALTGPQSAFLEGPGAVSGMMALAHRGLSIAGGTSEIKRNQIGERILGLPRDPLIK
ncbi:MAG: acyl-CoA dehydrogenase [Ilumatobacteraceae bacterium]